jgi:hypothetical protein
MNNTIPVGLGSEKPQIHFYIANRPMIDGYPSLDHLRPLVPGEIAYITKHTSNHWRKAFNVYAKLLFDWHLRKNHAGMRDSWQSYRDDGLFQAQTHEALLFSSPDLSKVVNNHFHIIAGKTYAGSLTLPSLVWLDAHFAINETHRLIVSPYPDYRQLSNMRIAQLIDIMCSFDALEKPDDTRD